MRGVVYPMVLLATGLLGLARSQAPIHLLGCYELTEAHAGDVIFSHSPDSIRLDARPDSSEPGHYRVSYVGHRSRSEFNTRFRSQVYWQPKSPDSIVVYAPLGMWMEHLRFAVDSAGSVRGRVFLYSDVVSPHDSAQPGAGLTGRRIRC